MSEYDASDPKQVKKRAREARQTERDRVDTLRWIMSQRDGRKYLRDLLADCGVFQDAFALNALGMAHNTGKRNIGLRILADLSRPELLDFYVQMLKEGDSEDAARRGREQQDGRKPDPDLDGLDSDRADVDPV